jgi:hypothetical protein
MSSSELWYTTDLHQCFLDFTASMARVKWRQQASFKWLITKGKCPWCRNTEDQNLYYLLFPYLTTIGWTPGGSSAVHIYTQTKYRYGTYITIKR